LLRNDVTPSRLEFRDVTVDFGPTRAIDHVSFSIQPGEVVGLLGHNGAGKTTLFNVVSGAIGASSGSFILDGEEFTGAVTPREISSRGVTVLHQEPALATNLSVLENLFLGGSGHLTKVMMQQAAKVLADVGADIDVMRPVGSLSLGERQLVALARGALAADIKVLLLDEPTAALGLRESEALHQLIGSFAASGVAVVYVSHRLPDILSICTRVVILSAGQIVAEGPTGKFDAGSLARALAPDMLTTSKEVPQISEPLIEVPAGKESLSVRGGEVVGLFGMAGGEQFDILSQLFGLAGRHEFLWNGEPMSIGSPRAAIRRGIYMVPADREKDGLVGGMSATDNVFSPWFQFMAARGWWVSKRTGVSEYGTARRELNIMGPDGAASIEQFSGGNRQKHLIARWMGVRPPKLLLLGHPTQGVDVGAKADIVRSVRSAAQQGAAVLVASAESDEIATLCDRAYVIDGHRVTEIASGARFDERLLETLLGIHHKQSTSQKRSQPNAAK
jgi:ABC-type sugar transport system ATPase subunit